MGCDLKKHNWTNARIDFNPRTHVGCDVAHLQRLVHLGVISIHAPTWGATSDESLNRFRTIRFQSTHPRGVRLLPASVCPHRLPISIHAPTWGATYDSGVIAPDTLFQSTHPRGVRRVRPAKVLLFSLFQSTHPRGVRQGFSAQGESAFQFQSTHPRGVRLPILRTPRAGRYFNPRTHVGCDTQRRYSTRRRLYFNPRTHVGCDGYSASYPGSDYPFQSTHPRGVRRILGILSRF